jgi:O-antigen/teichoic acid export membrane protein
MSERRRSAFLGMLFGYGSILIALARNVLLVPYYLHHIPLVEYGAWLATGGALALILINDFGLSGVVTQKISANYGAGNFTSLGSLIGSSFLIGLLLALMLTAVSLACIPFLPGMQTLTEVQKRTVVDCFFIAITANAAGLVGTTSISAMRSLQKIVPAGFIVMTADLANVAVAILALSGGRGLYAIAFGMLARSVILACGGGVGVAWIASRDMQVRIAVRWHTVLELLGDSSRFFFSSIAMKLQPQANVLFVGILLGPASAAIYSLTVRAHETVLMLLGQINASLVPSVTHLFGSGNSARFRAVLLRLLLSLGAVTALGMSVTVILNGAFLRLWLGGQVVGSPIVSGLMGIALFASALGFVAYDALVAQGKFNFVSTVLVAATLLHVLLLAALLRWGLWLAPAATLITACAWGSLLWKNVGASIVMTAAETRGMLGELARLGGVSIAAVAGFLSLYPPADSWMGLFAEGVICAAVIAGGYWLFSSKIRDILREEIGMTARALRPAG